MALNPKDCQNMLALYFKIIFAFNVQLIFFILSVIDNLNSENWDVVLVIYLMHNKLPQI